MDAGSFSELVWVSEIPTNHRAGEGVRSSGLDVKRRRRAARYHCLARRMEIGTRGIRIGLARSNHGEVDRRSLRCRALRGGTLIDETTELCGLQIRLSCPAKGACRRIEHSSA